jgi:hypothetical protein
VFELNLMTTDDLTEYKRLWPQPVPYVVLAAGLLIAGAGVPLHLGLSRSMMAGYDAEVSSCSVNMGFSGGCRLTPELAATRQRADIVQGVAIGMYVAGGVVAAIGTILLYVNRLQPYRITVGVTGKPTASLLPIIAPGAGGAAFRLELP